VMLDVMYEVPSAPDVVECKVTADCVTDGRKPQLHRRSRSEAAAPKTA
jgi:ATP-dependent protease Clp ATPase subunit